MTMLYPAVRGTRKPTHVGEMLREEVLPQISPEVSMDEFAKLLGLTRARLDLLLCDKLRVTEVLAERIGTFCGNGPGMWLRLQANYDEWETARAEDQQWQTFCS